MRRARLVAFLAGVARAAALAQHGQDPSARFYRRFQYETCVVDFGLYIGEKMVYCGNGVVDEVMGPSRLHTVKGR